jgi:mannonate dehydratase
VDTALWGIKAKTLDVPLYQLLGGASRDGVLVYGHASGVDIEDTVKAVLNMSRWAIRQFARRTESLDCKLRMA